MNEISRRKILKSAAIGTGALTISAPAIAQNKYNWKMVTTWPKNFPGLGTSANRLAKRIGEASDGKLNIKVYGAGEIVPAYEVFDAVRNGVAEMGHDSPYYWLAKHPATSFFSTVPAGLSAVEQTTWLLYGGGQELWDELYSNFGLKSFPAANAGLQMLGWYSKEINSIKDLKGMKIRMSGMHAEVLNRLGATTVNLPGGEVMTSLQSGVIDGVEWGGPWMDLAFGFHKIVKYCYGPGLHEPGANFSLTINKQAYDGLAKNLKQIIRSASLAELTASFSEFNYRNALAYKTLIEKHNVKMRRLPDDVIDNWFLISRKVISEVADHDSISKRIYQSWKNFRDHAIAIAPYNDLGFLEARHKRQL
ncbi:MAG: Monocarboxylate 2-oxoacid-binding periplasmic protein [Alphaproteobacteria bacterium MarineAlpha9_Bin2]|nr:MAG: Monocarboxylate 2-oxoacid-binding periplasmic protein [Alphaproteobacteria bacterium MarineAlpha9_Bin1]PPR31028.1 MAG: Monocarboxylate 2-oxoacid-binding periplasmic protein [Alphaproteobacteria bacterium MarineAlpha9_Bin2]